MYQQKFDFLIPGEYAGKEINLPESEIKLSIPKEAEYLDVNPLEDEEEFNGSQGDSDRQQIIYYNSKRKFLHLDNLDGLILTSKLMNELEKLFNTKN